MNSEIELSIIERVKKVLKITDENSPLELLQILRRHRNNFHPDTFTDESAKKEAEEKFKEISNLIDELDSYIQRERLQKSPMELALYQPLYENSTLQTKLDAALDENKDLKERLELYKHQIENLKEELQIKQESIIDKKQFDLVKIYRPTNNRLFSISFILVLSGIIPVLTKIESIANIIQKYAPFKTDQINMVMFIIFIFVIIFAIKKFIEYNFLKDKIADIKSPEYIQNFIDSIFEKKEFSENQVYSYIYGKKIKLKKILSFIGVKNFKSETINQLKDVFIHNLLFKQLIDIAYAENLDRRFRVKVKPKYYSEYYN